MDIKFKFFGKEYEMKQNHITDKIQMKTKIAMGQLHALPTMEATLEKAVDMIDEAAEKGAKLICFPEVGFEEFFPKKRCDRNQFKTAQRVPGPITDLMSKKAKEKEIVIVASFLEEGYLGEYYDCAVCIDADGELLGTTRMVHTFEDQGYNEKYYYGPGNTPYPVYETAAGVVGISICYDSWYPECFRTLALRGADIVVVPTCLVQSDGFYPDSDNKAGKLFDMVSNVQRANAMVNGLWVGVCNRVGVEDGIKYTGWSQIISPWGDIEAAGNLETDEVVISEVDLNVNREVRQLLPILRDRRPDTYEKVLEQYASKPYYHPERTRVD